jgi:ABC-type transport system substrate-binding protein
VMNRPDGGPQPRHAIERDGAGWTDPDRQVVSGPFRQARRTGDRLVLERRRDYRGPRGGNVRVVEFERSSVDEAERSFSRGDPDVITVRYTPRIADQVPAQAPGAPLGPAAWTGYLAFDHTRAPTSNVDLRRALAHAVDRVALAAVMPANLLVATGGVVPPALLGHTPDIVPRFDPDLARSCLVGGRCSRSFEPRGGRSSGLK